MRLAYELCLTPELIDDQLNVTQENAIRSSLILKKRALKIFVPKHIFRTCHE